MDISLLLKNRESPVHAQIDELVLDASIEENHQFKARVTKYPVENGSTISDHISNEPFELSIKGVISNHPLGNAISSGSSIALRRVQAAYFNLVQIREKRQLVSIVTGLSNYSDMALVSLSIPRNQQTGDSLEFTAEFIQIRFVDTVKIPAKYIKSEVKHTATTVDGGNKTPKGSTKSFDQAKSVAKKIKDSILGT